MQWSPIESPSFWQPSRKAIEACRRRFETRCCARLRKEGWATLSSDEGSTPLHAHRTIGRKRHHQREISTAFPLSTLALQPSCRHFLPDSHPPEIAIAANGSRQLFNINFQYQYVGSCSLVLGERSTPAGKRSLVRVCHVYAVLSRLRPGFKIVVFRQSQEGLGGSVYRTRQADRTSQT